MAFQEPLIKGLFALIPKCFAGTKMPKTDKNFKNMDASMQKLIVTVMANDRPGILALASNAIFQQGGNLEHVSQTILENQFAGLFIVSIPESLPEKDFTAKLEALLAPEGLDIRTKKITETEENLPASEPFVITCMGPDRRGLVSEITTILAGHKVNITKLRAMFAGGDDPAKNLMVYEVDIPLSADRSKLAEDLAKRAEALLLSINIQHRNIFESITRI